LNASTTEAVLTSDQKILPGSARPQRTLPYDEDAEKGVLASLIHAPKEAGELCRKQLKGEDFAAPAHRIIYEVLLSWTGNGEVEFPLALFSNQEPWSSRRSRRQRIPGRTDELPSDRMQRAILYRWSYRRVAPAKRRITRPAISSRRRQ